jgi:predicted nuclease of predicted toxin-antitoxin system
VRFKADENLHPDIVARLRVEGFDASTVLEESLSGADDDTLFRVAAGEGRILLTLDLDFANPVRFPTSGTPGILVLRVPRTSRALVLQAVEVALKFLEQESPAGRLWIVEVDRVRVHATDDE